MQLSSPVISSDRVNGTNVYPQRRQAGSYRLTDDKLTGKIRYAVMQFGGFLGIGSDLYPLPWDSLKYEPSQGGYVVSITKERLENAPHYEGVARIHRRLRPPCL
jgi:hypothetical protein